MELSVGQRIEEIIYYNRMNPNSFSNKIGTNDSVIRNIILGKNNPSFEMLHRILKAFNNINPEWLLTGYGKMIIDKNEGGIYIKGNNNKIGKEPEEKGVSKFEKENDLLKTKIEQLEKQLLAEKERVINIQTELIASLKK